MFENRTKDNSHLVHHRSNNGYREECKIKINNKIECQIKDLEHHLEAQREEKKRIQEDDSREPVMLDWSKQGSTLYRSKQARKTEVSICSLRDSCHRLLAGARGLSLRSITHFKRLISKSRRRSRAIRRAYWNLNQISLRALVVEEALEMKICSVQEERLQPKPTGRR